MAFVAASAAAAATTAGLAYLDARFHIRKDLDFIRANGRLTRAWETAVADKRTSLYYLIEKNAAVRPNYEAIWSRLGSYSFEQLYERANQYGRFFLSLGVKPGDLVALMMTNSPDFLMAWVGLWSVGAAPALINYNLGSGALVHCLKISTATLIFADGGSDMFTRLEEVRSDLDAGGYKVVRLDDVRRTIENLSTERTPDALREPVKGNWPFGLFYTSGTTGMPKACLLPVVAGFRHGVGSELGTNPVDRPDDRYYVCMPYYHGTGGINAMAQLMNGITVCVAPKFSVSRFWDDIRDSRATWFVYVGETLRYLLAAPESPRDKDHNVRCIYGNGLRPDVWKRFRDRFGIEKVIEFFNSTEGMLPLENPARGDFLANAVGHHGILLRRKYHELYVPVAVDVDTGDLARDPKTGFAYRVPYSQGGEILVKYPGERTFPGYFNNPEATEKKFVRDVFETGDCYYRTGDALKRDDHGRWYFMDRLGDTFRWKGENVSTAEVGEILGRYPGVVEANVYGVTLPGHDGKAGAAAIYVDPQHRSKFSHQDFLGYARKHLPKYAVPVFVRHIKEVSATHNNKQNKVPLKQEGVDPDKVKAEDDVFWIDSHGKGSTYVAFTREHWNDLHAGKARL